MCGPLLEDISEIVETGEDFTALCLATNKKRMGPQSPAVLILEMKEGLKSPRITRMNTNLD
jgi:hypothetical protein